MKLPRDVSAGRLLKALKPLGYEVTRQKGSHMRITTQMHGEHHEVVPAHDPLKTGTLRSVLRSVAMHHKMDVAVLIEWLG